MKKSGKKWFAFKFDADEKCREQDQYVSNCVTNSPEKSKNCMISVKKKPSFNFQRSLIPKTVSDLAVHPKKVKEVELWLQNNVINKPEDCQTASFLLITGPTGSGKTATVRVLCNNMSIHFSEWINPVDQNFEIHGGLNQVSRFSEFLMESKWNSLFSKNNKKVILIEEFPNALIRKPEDFAIILEECYYKGNHSVIFICTDSFDNGANLSQNLFPQEIKNKYGITHITFNSCATTLMKNVLKRAHSHVQENLHLFKTPSMSTVDAIISTSMGDIRCAINQYYFASLLGTPDLPIVGDKLSMKAGIKRKRSGNTPSVKLMSRDENLGLFHALGRVLNPKFTEVNNCWRLNCDIEKIVDEFSIQPGIFTAFLFENYVKYFGDVNDACKAAEILSLSETFLDRWVDRHDTLIFALWLSVLGLMTFNKHKVSKWNQIKGPSKITKKINNDPATRNLSTTDLFYYNIINKNHKSQFIKSEI